VITKLSEVKDIVRQAVSNPEQSFKDSLRKLKTTYPVEAEKIISNLENAPF
jgi:hypothetical protein